MSKVSVKTRDAVLRGYGYKCAKCGRGGELTMDHIMPLSRGGKNRKKNLQPLCTYCNGKKRDRVKRYQPGSWRRKEAS